MQTLQDCDVLVVAFALKRTAMYHHRHDFKIAASISTSPSFGENSL